LIGGLGVSTRFYLHEREARVEQARLRLRAEQATVEAERARAMEVQLRQQAEAREKVTQAAVLLSRGVTDAADALLDPIPAHLFTPSLEASDVFRSLGSWNMLKGRWKQAANRYLVLVQVNQVDKEEQSTAITFDLLTAAPLFIEAGNTEGYDRLRREALARLGGTLDPGAAEQLVKTSLLLPGNEMIMKQLEPLAQRISDSLLDYDPAKNDGYFLAAWRAFALALLEYRRGHFSETMDWLKKCSSYPDQSPSCVASAHILASMARCQLGDIERARPELEQGRALVGGYFGRTLELGDNKTGRLGGWIMTPILLREAEALLEIEPQP
jgi:eukaryotic-like serine/threonine-protein kinase